MLCIVGRIYKSHMDASSKSYVGFSIHKTESKEGRKKISEYPIWFIRCVEKIWFVFSNHVHFYFFRVLIRVCGWRGPEKTISNEFYFSCAKPEPINWNPSQYFEQSMCSAHWFLTSLFWNKCCEHAANYWWHSFGIHLWIRNDEFASIERQTLNSTMCAPMLAPKKFSWCKIIRNQNTYTSIGLIFCKHQPVCKHQ